jgi:glucose/arabinose dehydrogenase
MSTLLKVRNRKQIICLIALLLFLTTAVLVLPVFAVSISNDSAPQRTAVRPLEPFPNLTFTRPTVITHAGDDRLFVAEEAGRIWVLQGSGQNVSKTLYLDIVERVKDGCERGLLGLAFHPSYAENGYFYVNYIVDDEGKDLTRISRFQVSAVPGEAMPDSELVLLEVPQPACNHNGGDLHFDPQGMLVTGLGDGGFGGDPLNNGQGPQTMLGKLLRIDIDRQEGGKNYAIPADTPFLGDVGTLAEIWAFGLRNPWRFSFDRQTGDLWAGDVGQSAWEEIDIVTAGGDYGWDDREGAHCFEPATDCITDSIDPVTEYGRTLGASVTGGFVYRGVAVADLVGWYLFGDFVSGRLFAIPADSVPGTEPEVLLETGLGIAAFGESVDGELFIVNYGGSIHQVVSAP